MTDSESWDYNNFKDMETATQKEICPFIRILNILVYYHLVSTKQFNHQSKGIQSCL